MFSGWSWKVSLNYRLTMIRRHSLDQVTSLKGRTHPRVVTFLVFLRVWGAARASVPVANLGLRLFRSLLNLARRDLRVPAGLQARGYLPLFRCYLLSVRYLVLPNPRTESRSREHIRNEPPTALGRTCAAGSRLGRALVRVLCRLSRQLTRKRCSGANGLHLGVTRFDFHLLAVSK